MHKLLRLLRYDLPLHFVLLLTNILPDNTFFLRIRGTLVSPFLGSCGKDLRLGRCVTFYNPSQIHLGANVYIAYGCWFMAGEKIIVDNEVMFGPYCVAVSSNHQRLNASFRYGDPIKKPIYIGRGCWLSSHVTVTAGSVVGSGSLIAAGAAVTGNIPENKLAGGLPARVIGDL